MKRLALAVCLLAGLAMSAQPAQACSFSWKPGYSPREIPLRDDVLRIKGDFVFIDAVTGEEVPPNTPFNLQDGDAFGVIKRKGRKPVQTRMAYNDILIHCGAYAGPNGNVSGTFWVKRRRDKQGRYRLLLWKSI